ncbi:MAG: NADH-quinone oxidoreductase subunit NuoH [Chloroflexi bacterium]|jgi:NADH-quinone oxidoreductase subunit H|nr:NADH-quinone oxidoreductase subunit NuoH [Chloroflexota bacterium]HCH35959.1 NADH-quinone oxidoreductase subunit NuoH [Dehalococcoidia bacterium]|tara:strand:- start:5574 stop:6827 length:1254 start_codon:yes stop_codon:yes gene_type:complete
MRSLPAQLLLFAIILGGFLAIISAFVISVNLLGDPSSQLTVFLILKIVIALFALLTMVTIFGISLVWLERKELGHLQGRVGPTRVGPLGLLQVVADGIKLVTKEDVAPDKSSKILFNVAPLLVFVPSFVVWITIPLSPGLVVRSLDLGLFFFIAISVLSIVGLVLAGWSSNSKYAILGGFRSAAQLVSYEIPIIMAVIVVVMMTDSMNFLAVVDAQAKVPYIVIQPLAFLVFLIAGLAEVGRTPFDIYFAESEVVGGPFVEYSGAHWAIFFLAEYVNTFVIAALGALLFLGGWNWPFSDLPMILALLVFVAKTYFLASIIFWIRATYPRLRIDQLMSFGWKVLIPLAFASIFATAVQIFYGWPVWTLTVMSLVLIAIPAIIQIRFQRKGTLAIARRYAERAVQVNAVQRIKEPSNDS